MSVEWLACQCIERKTSESDIIQDAKQAKLSQSLLIIAIDREEINYEVRINRIKKGRHN